MVFMRLGSENRRLACQAGRNIARMQKEADLVSKKYTRSRSSDMQKPVLALLLLSSLAGLFASSAQAAGPPSFADWDQNKDRRVTLSEMKLAMSTQFKQADQNKDDQMTLEEVLNLMPFFVRNKARPKVIDYIRAQDLNRDGKLSQGEMVGSTQTRFARIDTNRDGMISEAEFNARPMPHR